LAHHLAALTPLARRPIARCPFKPLNESIPDAWPPEVPAEPSGGPVVPLFPLSNVWLFPGAVTPLHIFEPRYRQMIEDSLDQSGRIVIGTVMEGREVDLPNTPPVYPIAGLGEIGRHERLPDGRFLILLIGLARVRIREVQSDRPYRRVEVLPLKECGVAAERTDDLRRRLMEAVLERTDELLNLPEEMPIPALTDLLMLRMPLPHRVVRRIYTECDIEERALLALAEHAQRPHLEDKKPPRDGPEFPAN